MGILSFDKPQKLRSTEEHSKMYSSCTGIPGTYVPNMSKTDMERWKAKHIKGKDERIEIRKTLQGTQVVIVVYKDIREDSYDSKGWKPGHDNIQISANGKIQMTFQEWNELMMAVQEAKNILEVES